MGFKNEGEEMGLFEGKIEFDYARNQYRTTLIPFNWIVRGVLLVRRYVDIKLGKNLTESEELARIKSVLKRESQKEYDSKLELEKEVSFNKGFEAGKETAAKVIDKMFPKSRND